MAGVFYRHLPISFLITIKTNSSMKSWTIEDNKILKECMDRYPTHSKAFKEAAEKLGKTSKAVCQHYYNNKHVLALYNTEKVSVFSKLFSSLRGLFIIK